MPIHHNDQKDNEYSGKRHIEGQPKAGALPVGDFSVAEEAKLAQEALDAGLTHPNRGHDKPSIDKPAYD